jgi:hypothetical protein
MALSSVKRGIFMGTFLSPLLQQRLVAYDIKIPEAVLTSAERLSLSALGNGIQNFHKFSEVADERDEFLMFRLDQLFKNIPYETRRACFDEVGRLYRERREEREDRRY